MLVARKILKFSDRLIHPGEPVSEDLLSPRTKQALLGLGRIEKVAGAPPPTHSCNPCGRDFKSSRALRVHLSYHQGRAKKWAGPIQVTQETRTKTPSDS